MPMAELADAIVQSGRETLENAIRMVNGHPDWRAQVVYGDTGGQVDGDTRRKQVGELCGVVWKGASPCVPCCLSSK